MKMEKPLLSFQNLPGDGKGNITLIARLDENEMYGNLEACGTEMGNSGFR